MTDQPPPKKVTRKKVDSVRPGFSRSEPPTRPNSPAHRATRLIAGWAKLSPQRMRLVEELILELGEDAVTTT